MYFDAEWSQVLTERDAALLRSLQDSGLKLETTDFTRQMDDRLTSYYQERNTEFLEYTSGYILRSLLADLGYPEVPEPVIRRALRDWYATTQAHWQVEADTVPTLETLRERGYRLGLVSNAGDDDDVHTLVDQFGIRPYFEVIVTSAAQGIRKPNPRIFHTALRHWQAAPEQAVMVGDSLGADILGARNAGMLAVWITRHADTAANQAHLDTIQPDASISALSELPDLLENL